MSDPQFHKSSTEACAKHLWVMLALSDDEQVDENGALPLGLQSHLSHCESCRVVADRLLSVTKAISELAKLEPAGNLLPRADAQALAAIKDGATLTGRVDIPEDEVPEAAAHPVPAWVGLRRYAAAAAVLAIAVGLFWTLRHGTPDRPGVGLSSPVDGAAVSVPVHAGTEEPSDSPSTIAAEVVGRTGSEQMAETGPKPGPSRPQRAICRHHSHQEAALSDDDTCVPRAVILPDPTQRHLGWGGMFDREATVESTGDLPEQE